MPKASKKVVTKFSALEKSIENSIGTLKTVCDSGAAAVAVQTKEKQRLLTESKRLNKKKTSLLKKKRVTVAKLQKAPDVEARKTLKLVEKELTSVAKNLARTNVEKATIAQELAGLKLHMKRVTAYLKGVNLADRALNKSLKRGKSRVKTEVSGIAA